MSKNKHKFDSELARKNLDSLFTDSFYESSTLNYIDNMDNKETRDINYFSNTKSTIRFSDLLIGLDNSIQEISDINGNLREVELFLFGEITSSLEDLKGSSEISNLEDKGILLKLFKKLLILQELIKQNKLISDKIVETVK